MKTKRFLLLLFLPYIIGSASNVDISEIALTIEEINLLAFSENEAIIVCNQFSSEAIQGFYDQLSYSLWTNDGKVKKITTSLDKAIPNQAKLSLTLSTLPGWISYPNLELSQNKQDIVRNITPHSFASDLGVSISLQLPRTTKATKKPMSRRLIFTLTDD